MKKTSSVKFELLAILFSVIVVVILAMDMVGRPARLVLILTIVAGSLSAGISTGRLIERFRRGREVKPADNNHKTGMMRNGE